MEREGREESLTPYFVKGPLNIVTLGRWAGVFVPGQSHLNWGYVVRRKALQRHTVLSDLPIICWTIRFV